MKHCKLCQSVGEDNTGPVCRLKPPVSFITPRGELMTVWPAVDPESDWCDDFMKKIEPSEQVD